LIPIGALPKEKSEKIFTLPKTENAYESNGGEDDTKGDTFESCRIHRQESIPKLLG